jgi:hypothetical protein
MKKYTKTFYFLLLLLNYQLLYAQQSFDSSFADAQAVYTKAIGVNAHLYTGSEYVDYDHTMTGNPYFASLYFTNGAIVYDDILYKNVQMFYDILNDDVVLKNYNDTALLLPKEKVSSFSFAGHNFIKIIPDSATAEIKPGYYEVLYNGNTKLFAKRKKEITEKIQIQYYEALFTEHDQYYILKNDVFYQVGDKNGALNVMKDRKKELSKFIHQEKLKFRKNFESSLLKTVAYYNGLNNTK